VDLDHPRTQPVHHVISQLIYSVASGQVSDVWVAGHRLLRDGALTRMDESEVLHRAKAWARDAVARPITGRAVQS
jgi:5-methylthioadenosine/S-adenosylhomocysteine deaminase